MMDNIRLIFILPEKYADEQESSEIMLQAFEACRQNVKTDVSWVKESNFDALPINKTDFIIFEEFKGTVFESLKETKCARILGPWAISICLMEGKAIPNFPWPIYNVAMYDCIVTCSNLPKSSKMAIKEKVHVMGGCYVDTLVEKITHLVTDTPNSEKYSAAAEAGVTLMCSSWIDAVWTASQTSNVHANDQAFKTHSCLAFQNLNICCTGLSCSREKREFEKLITKHGGKFSAQLKLADADFLVCSGVGGSTSEKYKAARKRGSIKCVDIAWVTESIIKGYALREDLYPVKKPTSTPNRNETLANPDFSVLSVINGPHMSSRISIDDSINATVTQGTRFHSPSKPGPSKRKGNLKEDYALLVDKLDIKKVKKAGQYLDGCSVYMTGFSPEHSEKLCKILNLSGATRYDKFSDRVTHVIVGDPKYHEVNVIKSKGYQCVLVSVHWLVESINKEQPVNEEMYLLSTSDFDTSDFSSPLSKKGLKLLRSNKTVTKSDIQEDKPIENVEDNIEKDILQQYLKPANTVQEDDTLALLLKNADNSNFSDQCQDLPKNLAQFNPCETSTQQSSAAVTQDESETTSQMFFEGLKFLIVGFEDPTRYEFIKELIEGFYGNVVPKNFKGIPDYLVVPVFVKCDMQNTAKEVVNELFINDCAKEDCLLQEISYYHRPFPLPDITPLENTVITISGYTSYERTFLQGFIEALGGMHQEQFARVSSKARGVVASTHLVSDQASGKKFSAAVKWGLPVVNKDWLLECARTGQRMSEKDYSVLGNDASAENILAAPCAAREQSKTLISTVHSSNANNDQGIDTPVSVKSTTKPNTMTSAEARMKSANISENNQQMVYPNLPTPSPSKRPTETSESSRNTSVFTPVNHLLSRTLSLNDSMDAPFTQPTPVNKILQQYRESNTAGSPLPFSPEVVPWMGIKTPEAPLGACIRANPSPQLRKECEYWVQQFPDYIPRRRRKSTPFAQIKNQVYSKVLNREDSDEIVKTRRNGNADMGLASSSNEMPISGIRRELYKKVLTRAESEEYVQSRPDQNEVCGTEVSSNNASSTPELSTQNQVLNSNIQKLEEMLSASVAGKRQSRNFQSTIPIPEGNTQYKDSQACTVGWDFREQDQPLTVGWDFEIEVAPKAKIFILSGVSNPTRERMVEQLESLGATVSELINFDPKGTHLLCPKPARNEKTLSSMAAGLWILHTSYLDRCLEAGYFLDEEEYEFGNSKSAGKFEVEFGQDTEVRMNVMHWWRKEIMRRGYRAFNDMRAIVVAEKSGPIIRVIEAGGGVVVDVSSPFDDTVHATHCLLEQRFVRNFADYIPLAQQGIYLLSTVYVSDYLHEPQKDVRQCILPYFAKYYSRT